MQAFWKLFGTPQWSLIEAHQASTHLSLGLLIGAFFFDIGALVWQRRRTTWRDIAFWMQMAGTGALVLTFGLGFYGNPYAGQNTEWAQRVEWHKNFAYVVLAFFCVLAIWRATRFSQWRRVESVLYALITLIGILLITATGWMGGHIA